MSNRTIKNISIQESPCSINKAALAVMTKLILECIFHPIHLLQIFLKKYFNIMEQVQADSVVTVLVTSYNDRFMQLTSTNSRL